MTSFGTPARDPLTGRFVKTFELRYETKSVAFVRDVSAAEVERTGVVVASAAARGALWNITVLDSQGVDVTRSFVSFQH